VKRVLKVGELMLVRQPGRASKPVDSWKGSYKTMDKLNDLNYRVAVSRSAKKVLHINNLCRERQL